MYYNRTQTGVYYGGQVAGPVMKELLSNVLPYIGIKPEYSEKELKLNEVKVLKVGNYIGMTENEAKNAITKEKLKYAIKGEGEKVVNQFPLPDSDTNENNKIILYMGN